MCLTLAGTCAIGTVVVPVALLVMSRPAARLRICTAWDRTTRGRQATLTLLVLYKQVSLYRHHRRSVPSILQLAVVQPSNQTRLVFIGGAAIHYGRPVTDTAREMESSTSLKIQS